MEDSKYPHLVYYYLVITLFLSRSLRGSVALQLRSLSDDSCFALAECRLPTAVLSIDNHRSLKHIREKFKQQARLSLRQISTALPRDFHGVTPTFPRGNPEFSTALPHPTDIRGFIGRHKPPVSELRAVALHAPITPIVLCYDETGRKSSEIGSSKSTPEIS